MDSKLRIAKDILVIAKQLMADATENEVEIAQWVKAFDTKYNLSEGTRGKPTIDGVWLWIYLNKDGGYCHWSGGGCGVPSWNRDTYKTRFPKYDKPLPRYRKELAKCFKSLKDDVTSFWGRFQKYENDVKKVCDWLDTLAEAALKDDINFKVENSVDNLKCVDDEFRMHEKKGDLNQWLSQYHWTKFVPKGADLKYGRLWVDWEKKVYRGHCTIDEFYGGGVVD